LNLSGVYTMMGMNPNPNELVFVGFLVLTIIVLVVFIVFILKRQDRKSAEPEAVPDTLPQLTPPEQPKKDFRDIVADEIERAIERKEHIEQDVKNLETEYMQLKGDLMKLEIIKKGMQ